MKRTSTIFLQAVIMLTGIAVLAIMIRFPLIEGRAENLDLFHIYFDPFILYVYAASIAFFVALYKAFRLLGYIGKNKAFSQNSVNALRSIKHYATLLTILIVLAGIYIRIFHNKDDDPAGFLAVCMVAGFACIVVAVVSSVLEKIFQNGMDIKTENEQLHELLKK